MRFLSASKRHVWRSCFKPTTPESVVCTAFKQRLIFVMSTERLNCCMTRKSPAFEGANDAMQRGCPR